MIASARPDECMDQGRKAEEEAACTKNQGSKRPAAVLLAGVAPSLVPFLFSGFAYICASFAPVNVTHRLAAGPVEYETTTVRNDCPCYKDMQW